MYSAKNVGAKKILVETGRGLKSLQELHLKTPDKLTIDYVATNVLSAVEWLLRDLESCS